MARIDHSFTMSEPPAQALPLELLGQPGQWPQRSRGA
jgi:hypothetical protein